MNWLSNLKLRTQILVAFAVLAVTAAIVSGLGVRNILIMSDTMDTISQFSIGELQTLDRLNTSFQRMHGDFTMMILSRTVDEAKDFADQCRKRNEEVDRLASELQNSVEGDERTVIQQFMNESKQFSQYRQQIEALSVAGKMEDARTLLYGEVSKVRSTMQDDLAKLSEALRVDGEQRARDGKDLAHVTVTTTLGGSLLAVLVVVILGLFIVRSVTRPLAQVVQSVDSADLNTVFNSTRKDEIGELMRSFDRFVLTIKETLLRVSEASAAVASASSEISSSAEQMAAGAQQQSAQAGDVSAAVEEMTKTIFENSRNAASTSETAKTAKQAAEQGGKVVLESVAGMKRIAEAVKQSAQTVRELGKSSEQIGNIVSVIDDIADQTNLLALNAAIEAARAGEQGRGFAVVADEVRKLAERTTNATKEIAEMIKKIQKDTREAVGSMEQGTKEVDLGIQSADAAGMSLKEIVQISERVTEKVVQIAAGSEQQAGASEEISKNVEAISTVTQETAGGIQQIARTAEDLNRLTENLQQLISRFKLSTSKAQDSAPGVASNVAKGTSGKQTRKTGTGTTSHLAVRQNGFLVDERSHNGQ
jgi:methyl-accepting chemotaxis protein